MTGWPDFRRVARHLWWDADDGHRLIPPTVAQRLAERVAASERRHTGEIRVCVEAAWPITLWDPLIRPGPLHGAIRMRALSWFGQLGVWDTRDNNGVLIYVLLAERAVEIVADRGLSERLPPDAWTAVLDAMRAPLQAGAFEAAFDIAIDAVDAMLTQHFPETGDTPKANELPDAVVLC